MRHIIDTKINYMLYIDVIRRGVSLMIRKVLKSSKGIGYIDVAIKILICVVCGTLVLGSTYYIMKDTVLRKVNTEITDMFNAPEENPIVGEPDGEPIDEEEPMDSVFILPSRFGAIPEEELDDPSFPIELDTLSIIEPQVIKTDPPYKMRFATELFCTCINDNLQITYNSKVYTVVEYGTLLIVTERLNPGEELTLDLENQYLSIFPSTVTYQETDYPNNKKSIIFTVVISNMPAAAREKTVSQRAYVKALSPQNNEVTFYSEIRAYSVADVS